MAGETRACGTLRFCFAKPQSRASPYQKSSKHSKNCKPFFGCPYDFRHGSCLTRKNKSPLHTVCVQRANVSRYHLFLQNHILHLFFCNGNSRNNLLTFCLARRIHIRPFNRQTIKLQLFSSKATFRTRFPWTASQPVSRPLCQCAVRTPLSHHLLDRSYLNEHNTICQDIFYICCISL